MKVRLEGFRQLEEQLALLSKATGKSALRKTAVKALAPVRDAARAKAPVESGLLRNSIGIKLAKDNDYAKRARAAFVSMGSAKGVKRSRSTGISMSVGPIARRERHRRSGRPTGLWAYAFYQEYGTVHSPPQPYMRPAWDAQKHNVLEIVKTELVVEIRKATARAAKRRARRAR